MHRPTDHRTPHRAAALSLLLLLAVACAGPAAPSSGPSVLPTPAPSTPSSTPPSAATPVPSSIPADAEPVEVTLPQLVEDMAAFDGLRVLVTGSYVETPQGQVLCELLLESYPPRAGGAMVALLGQLPQEIRDRLDSTTDEPDLAPVTWGYVDVIGIFHAEGGSGPAIELEQVRIAGTE